MKIIINADDFGYNRSVNKSIIDLAGIGTLSSTTVMVNFEAAEEVKALYEFEDFSTGLHFNLTEGRPVSDPNEVKTLVDQNGFFWNYKTFIRRLKAKSIAPQEIYRELENQYKRFVSLSGNHPTHIDSHQNVHKQFPVVRELCRFAGAVGRKLRVRNPDRYILHNNHIQKFFYSDSFTHSIRYNTTNLYLSFLSYYYSKHFSTAYGELHYHTRKKVDMFEWISTTRQIPNSPYIFEIPCHPSVDTNGLENSALKQQRVDEYKLLSSNLFQENLKRFELISYKSI